MTTTPITVRQLGDLVVPAVGVGAGTAHEASPWSWCPHSIGALRVFPNRTVSDGDTVALGGLDLRVRSLGPGESFADTIWQLDDDTLFVGDVAYNGMHAFLADGQWPQWLDLTDRLHRDLPSTATLYVGHGPPGGKDLLAAQRRYIETFVESVRRHAATVAGGDHRPVLDDLRSIVPSEDLLFLADLSIAPTLAQITDG